MPESKRHFRINPPIHANDYQEPPCWKLDESVIGFSLLYLTMHHELYTLINVECAENYTSSSNIKVSLLSDRQATINAP